MGRMFAFSSKSEINFSRRYVYAGISDIFSPSFKNWRVLTKIFLAIFCFIHLLGWLDHYLKLKKFKKQYPTGCLNMLCNTSNHLLGIKNTLLSHKNSICTFMRCGNLTYDTLIWLKVTSMASTASVLNDGRI